MESHKLISFLKEHSSSKVIIGDEKLVLAALDNDQLFNDFFNSEAINEEVLSNGNKNELEIIESYFQSQDFDLSFITN